MLKEQIREIKFQFFTFRNGLIGERLRESGDPHKIIFGLNLPQITDIAKGCEHTPQLAQAMWDNQSTRESKIIATMLYPAEQFSQATAQQWIAEIPTYEIADILCHKLLRNTQYAEELIYKYSSESSTMMERYLALRLALNLLTIGKLTNTKKLATIAETELTLNLSPTIMVSQRILSEIAEQ
ncbi:MAG: DNA alkylation repair protein [Bacteroidales bacterium]